MITLDQLQAVTPKVLERLRTMATLPEGGTVAGQAVASLFWEELGLPLRGPINDIDVFVNCWLPREKRGLPAGPPTTSGHRIQSTVQNFGGIEVGDDRYVHVKFIALRQETSIMRTYQAGLVNYTLIAHPDIPRGDVGHGRQISHNIISGFDLNLVQVGINLSDEQVVASTSFLEFLNHRQIQVATCNTPSHTLVRLARKCFDHQITGAICDFDAEREILETAILCQEVGRKKHNTLNINRLGERYQAHSQRLAKWLPERELKTSTMADGSVYTFEHFLPQPENEARAADMIDMAFKVNDHATFNRLFVAEFPRLYRFWQNTGELQDKTTENERGDFQILARAVGTANDIEILAAWNRICNDVVLPKTMELMDEADCLVFFLGTKKTLTQKDVDEVQQAWQGFESSTQKTLQAMGTTAAGADVVLEFSRQGAQGWQWLLQKEPEILMRAICWLPKHDESDGKRHRLLNHLLDHVEERDVIAKLCRNPHNILKGVSITFGGDEREQLIRRVLGYLAPGWPVPENGRWSDYLTEAYGYWIDVNYQQPLPEELWRGLNDQGVRGLMKAVTEEWGGKSSGRSVQLWPLLPIISLDDLEYMDGFLVSQLIRTDKEFFGALEARFGSDARWNALLTHIADIGANVNTTTDFDFLGGEIEFGMRHLGQHDVRWLQHHILTRQVSGQKERPRRRL